MPAEVRRLWQRWFLPMTATASAKHVLIVCVATCEVSSSDLSTFLIAADMLQFFSFKLHFKNAN